MKLIFQLLKEHPTLPMAELRGVLEGERSAYEILEEHGNVAVLDVKSRSHTFVKRLALTKMAAEYVGKSKDIRDLAGLIYQSIVGCKSFRVRCESHRVEDALGAEIHGLGLRVDLANPDREILCFHDKEYMAGISIPSKRDFEDRKPQLRPYFHPTGMHPKIARVLVNLARVRKGDVVLDPFCGTGGVLIEAGLIGMKAVGRDIDEKMVEGCKKNLNRYGLKGDISAGDALDLSIGADAIVTDPPYGRSSFASREPERLYDRFLGNVSKNLKRGGFLVFVSPKDYKPSFKNLGLLEVYDMRVHKSLTRRVWVLKNG